MSSPSVKRPASYSVLSLINNPKITSFWFRFRNVHAYPPTRSRWIQFPDQHPLAPAVYERYAAREEVPLWWDCIALREAGQTDRVVRSWLARRARNAFKKSLGKKGYDANGRPLPGSGNKANLFGTAAFAVKREATTHSFVDMVKEMDIAVSYIQRHQDGQKDNGKSRQSKQRKGHWQGLSHSKRTSR